MRSFNSVLLIGLLAGLVHAQESSMVDGLENPAQLRASIEHERNQRQKEWDRLENACYQQFAVNDCLKDVQQQRTREMSEFKRQLEVLESSARLRRATEQLQRLEQKTQAQQLREQERAEVETVIPRQPKQPSNPSPQPAVRTPKASSVPISPNQARQNQQLYEKKLQDAQKRKAERDKRLIERDPEAKRLPTTP